MGRNAIYIYAGIALLSITLAGMAWFAGAFIYRCAFVHHKIEIVRPMEWIAFLMPLLSLLALAAITIFANSWMHKVAVWMLPLFLIVNVLVQIAKLGWFFSGWGGGGFG